jgi:lantibiotic modifying enzyme
LIQQRQKLIKQATQLLQRSAQVTLEKHEFDLIAGNAGAITALVILQAILDDRSLLEFATRLGDELLESAEISKAGYSWKSTAISRQRRNLTGFFHGTAGVGYALLELFQATGDLKYRRAAEQAFNYERHWFNADIGNWPDFRKDSTQVGQRTDQRSFANAWCHGAPGIALSRLRAYQLLKDESYKTESLIALQTTARVTEAALQSKSSN